MEYGDGEQRLSEARALSAMVAEYSPVFEPCNRMLDTSPSATVSSPRVVADLPPTPKHGRDELSYAAVAAISKYAAMMSSPRLFRHGAPRPQP